MPDDIRSLAFVGDAVCHLYIRQKLVGAGGNVKGLTGEAARSASAAGQAQAYAAIADLLLEDESDIFRRGRNAHCGSIPRNADPVDYRKATGFEALMGWLYLSGRRERLEELLALAYAPQKPE